MAGVHQSVIPVHSGIHYQKETSFLKALIIGGGKWQLPLINFFKSKNYLIGVVDPYNESPGVLIADWHIKCDVRDTDTIFSQIKDSAYSIITSDQSDIAVDSVAVLTKKLGLKGNDINAVTRFSNKYISREFSKQIGMPIPQYTKIEDLQQLKQFIQTVGLPVLLKPSDSQSSRGIFLVYNNDENQLLAGLNHAFSATKQAYIIAEKYVVGEEYTVEGICINGKHKTLAISHKNHFRTGIASALEYPAQLPVELENTLKTLNNSYVEKSGLDFGITHAEYIIDLDSKSINLVEIACRGGGTLISSHITKWVTGVDNYELLFLALKNELVDINKIKLKRRYAILQFFEFPNGVVQNITGVEEIKKFSGVLELQLEFRAGDKIHSATDDRSRQGFVILLADTKDQLQTRLKLVIQTLKVEIL
jgi:biotin carboxylase